MSSLGMIARVSRIDQIAGCIESDIATQADMVGLVQGKRDLRRAGGRMEVGR